MNLRPKTFRAKLLLLFVLIVAAAQLTTGFIVSRISATQARTLIEQDLDRAAEAFDRIVAERRTLLTSGAFTAGRAFEIKMVFVREEPATLASALDSIRNAIRSDIVLAVGLDGKLLAAKPAIPPETDIYRQLAAKAEADTSPNPTAEGYGYIGDSLYSLVLVPVRSPDIIAWLALGFRIDNELAKTLKAQTGIDVTFLDHEGHSLATTLSALSANSLMSALPQDREMAKTIELPLAHDTALIQMRRLPAGQQRSATLLLQYSLDEKLRPARVLHWTILGITFGSLALAVIIAQVFSQRLAKPIVELVGHTRRIARGDYSIRNKSYRDDELGRLSEAFDQMASGLDERERIRDAFGKAVSPEIARQLLREGTKLGGEERLVTILFADIRGFTPLSEKLAPQALITLLNRYLDRMVTVINSHHGGHVDKFIGDSIMALFGAPLAQPDAADRALAAALEMERALVELNRELVAEGHSPLAIGIGINTARVVAGNMGSHSRHNYTVVGDGVNVASRLQSLTRTPEYNTDLITSAATLAALQSPATFRARSLGSVHVKGRAEPVEIFAVE